MQERPETFITSMIGHPSNRTVLCTRCGAFIVDHPEWIGKHTAFHEEIDEMADWAQAVSKMFKPTEGEKPVE